MVGIGPGQNQELLLLFPDLYQAAGLEVGADWLSYGMLTLQTVALIAMYNVDPLIIFKMGFYLVVESVELNMLNYYKIQFLKYFKNSYSSFTVLERFTCPGSKHTSSFSSGTFIILTFKMYDNDSLEVVFVSGVG